MTYVLQLEFGEDRPMMLDQSAERPDVEETARRMTRTWNRGGALPVSGLLVRRVDTFARSWRVILDDGRIGWLKIREAVD